MSSDFKAIVRSVSQGSDEGSITFPEVVAKLTQAGVERYHRNLVDGTTTYYMPDDSFEIVPGTPPSAPTQNFAAQDVEQAVRTVQRGELGYREFCERVAQAGCVGYFVSLVGKRVDYYGRTNEAHTEFFPGVK